MMKYAIRTINKKDGRYLWVCDVHGLLIFDNHSLADKYLHRFCDTLPLKEWRVVESDMYF